MTRPPATTPDTEIRTHGQPLGRFTWQHSTDCTGRQTGDWYPDPNGTHTGWIYRLAFYCLEEDPNPQDVAP